MCFFPKAMVKVQKSIGDNCIALKFKQKVDHKAIFIA